MISVFGHHLKQLMLKKLILSCLILFSFCLKGQKSLQGIYYSVNDVRQNKIYYTPVPGKKYRLILNQSLFYKPIIKIIIGDSSYILNKDSIFGYRDRDNTIHHFYKKNDLEVLNPQEQILLYRGFHLGGYKGVETISEYYFSPTYDIKSIYPLSNWNLKKAFPNDSLFHELLDIYFTCNNALTQYDRFYKMYKLNRVYQLSKEFIIRKKDI